MPERTSPLIKEAKKVTEKVSYLEIKLGGGEIRRLFLHTLE